MSQIFLDCYNVIKHESFNILTLKRTTNRIPIEPLRRATDRLTYVSLHCGLGGNCTGANFENINMMEDDSHRHISIKERGIWSMITRASRTTGAKGNNLFASNSKL